MLNVHQSDFRSGHSTVLAAMLVLNVLNCLDHRNHCAAIFIDLAKAFDTVDHPLLIQRLSEMGLDHLASGLGTICQTGHNVCFLMV
jgi:hypothetical protein